MHYKQAINQSILDNYYIKVIIGDLTSTTQDLLHYFHTTLITTLLLNLHQEGIQFRAAEETIGQDHYYLLL